MAESQLSPLEQALANRKRASHVFDALALKSDGSNPGPIAFRVPTKQEEIDAQVYAAKWLADGLGRNTNNELAADVATIWILHTAARDARDAMVPAFGRGPQWMAQHLTSDEFLVLLNCLHEARERESPFGRRIDQETVDEYAAMLGGLELDDAGEALLSLQREDLLRLCIGLARKVNDG